jgi:Zn-dependent protease with chaperone function
MDNPKKYESIKYLIAVSGFALDIVILIYLLLHGSVRIRDFAESAASSEAIAVLIYILVVGFIFKLVQLPLAFYSGYLIEHRFQLSRQTVADWVKDQLKGLAVGIPLGVGAVELVYYLLRAHPESWWLYAGVAFVVFVIAVANLAPILLLPLFFKFRPVENAELQDRVARLARRTGARICGIFEWSLGEKTRKANAAVVGWGNTRRIIVSDTLLENFSGEEIEVIMAHELCHHVKHHIWLGLALQSTLTMFGFYTLHRILPYFSRAFGFRGPSDIATFPVLALSITFLSLTVLPAVNVFSRWLETTADLYALDVTGDALAFVSSMEKLADLNMANRTPNKIIEFIFYSHPSIEARIKLAADRVGQNVGI